MNAGPPGPAGTRGCPGQGGVGLTAVGGRGWRGWGLTALLLLGPSALLRSLPAESPVVAASRTGLPAMRVFTDRDGLPQNSVEEILIDKKGYLWVGTQDGAAYYNGRRWTHIKLHG